MNENVKERRKLITFSIDGEIIKNFKLKAKNENRKYSNVIEMFMKNYLKLNIKENSSSIDSFNDTQQKVINYEDEDLLYEAEYDAAMEYFEEESIKNNNSLKDLNSSTSIQ